MTVRSALRAPVRAAVRAPIILRKRWTPAALFADGQQGVWFEASPTYKGQQVLWQQSDGTVIVDASGDPVGRADDLSPNGNHLTQSVSADRPTYGADGALHWLGFDGVGDFLDMTPVSTAVTTTVSVFIAFKRDDLSTVLLLGGDATGEFCLIARSGDTDGVIVGGADPGSPITRIDGVDKTTRDAIHDATSDLDYHIWEMEGLTVDSWGTMTFGNYASGGFEPNGRCAGIIIVDESSPVDRQSARDYLKKRAGI